MQNNNIRRKKITCLSFLLVSLFFYVHSISAEILKVDYEFQKPYGQKSQITLQGLENWSETGKPVLPFKPVKILVPFGERVTNISFISQEPETLDGFYDVQPGQPIVHTSQSVNLNTVKDSKIYNLSTPYPGETPSSYTTQRLRGFDILISKLYPVQYIPKEGKIFYYKKITVEVTTSLNSKSGGEQKEMLRTDKRTLDRINNMADNKNIVTSYPIGLKSGHHPKSAFLSGKGPYDYIIITCDSLKDTFQTLVNWKISRGLQAGIFTTDSIYAYYSGVDNQDRIRNFIIDCYQTWNGTSHPLQWAALGGDAAIIPVRGLYGWANDGVGSPVDPTIPCDLYYAGLDGNWDNDADGVYGEGSSTDSGTGTSGEEADLLAEIAVGRIAVSNGSEAGNYIRKLIHYEGSPNVNSLKNALFVGEKLDKYTWGGDKKDLVAGLIPQCDITKLYERNDAEVGNVYNHIESYLNTGPHIVNHLGHSYWDYIFGGCNQSLPNNLTNTEYFLLYSQGCWSAALDYSSVGEHFISATNGAFAYIGNTRDGWYGQGNFENDNNEGPGEQFDHSFLNTVFTNNIRNIGTALNNGKEDLVSSIGARGCMRWCYFTINLLGDPETPIVTAYETPIANISSVSKNCGDAVLKGTAMKGSASGANFLNYRFEWSFVNAPSVWYPLPDTFYQPVNNDTLYLLNARLIPEDSAVNIKLVVSDSLSRLNENVTSLLINNCCIWTLAQVYAEAETVIVSGNANVQNFTHYSIKFRKTEDTVWSSTGLTLQKNGTSEVSQDSLAKWNLSGFSSGTYILKLTTYGKDTLEDSTFLVIDNCVITYPIRDTTLGMSNIIQVYGTASGPGFNHYTIQYGKGAYPLSWDTAGITLSNNGTLRVITGTLGTWDPSKLVPNAIYSLRLMVNDSIDGDTTKVQFVHFYFPGWPRYGGGNNAPIACDIDQNGSIEMFITSNDGFMVFEHTGTYIWSDPHTNNIIAEPSFGTLDSCMYYPNAFVMAGKDSLYAINYHGIYGAWKTVSGFPLAIPGIPHSPAVVVNLDNDSLEENIVYCSSNDSVYVIKGDASIRSGWPLYAPGVIKASVGDLNEDGQIEIAFGDSSGKFYVVKKDASPLPGWPITLDGTVLVPSIGDIDGDRKREIVVCTSKGTLYVLKPDGSIQSGWPQKVDIGLMPLAFMQPALGNLYQDTTLEVVISSNSNTNPLASVLWVFQADGKVAPGWPDTIWTNKSDTITTPVIGDVYYRNPGAIMVGTSAGYIYAYNPDGSLVRKYPQALGEIWGRIAAPSVTLTDFNSDSYTDVFIEGEAENSAIYTQDGEVNALEWPTYQADISHTGCYKFGPRVQGITEKQHILTSWVSEVTPNPFSNKTMLYFSVPKSSQVKINIYNITGRKVKMLFNKTVKPGVYPIEWSGKDDKGYKLSYGVYFMRVEGVGKTTTRKLVFLK